MKQFVLTLIAVLIGGFLALLGYDHFIVKPREADMARSAPVPVDMTRARSEAKAVADEVEASVQRSVETAKASMAAEAQAMDRRAMVSDAVRRATMFRVSLTEYYQANGRWPADADEAGLPSPEEMRGGAVRAVSLGKRGQVSIALDDNFAPGSAIVLEPVTDAMGAIDWRCRVEGDPALKQSLPRCEG
ncbi:MAG: pilin [Pseudomonadota bacterium]